MLFAWPNCSVFAWPQAWEALTVLPGITVQFLPGHKPGKLHPFLVPPSFYWINRKKTGQLDRGCTVYSIQYTVYSAQCTVYSVQCVECTTAVDNGVPRTRQTVVILTVVIGTVVIGTVVIWTVVIVTVVIVTVVK